MTRVWLPDSPEAFGGLPAGIEADVWQGGAEFPPTAGDVEFVVLPFSVEPEIIRKIGTLPKLKTVQILSAGADNILPYLPARITLCNARGAHTPATAEWTVGAIVASLRSFPRFIAAQLAGHWDFARTGSVGGKRVLIVGYGSIGEAVERRLAGWEVAVDRVARHARDGVHAMDELPRLLPDADVVVILVPVTEETKKLVNAEFLKTMKDGALLVNAARGVIVDTDALLAELTSGRLRPRSTSPTRSRCRTAIPSGPRLACCSPRTSAGRSGPSRTGPTPWSPLSSPGWPQASRCSTSSARTGIRRRPGQSPSHRGYAWRGCRLR